MRRIEVRELPLTAFGSTGAVQRLPTAGPRQRWRTAGPASVVVLELAPGGAVGRHPTVDEQLLLVVTGSVSCTGGDGAAVEVPAGQAVVFERGEDHETRSVDGATLVVVEQLPPASSDSA